MTNLTQRLDTSLDTGWHEAQVVPTTHLSTMDFREYLRILFRQKKLIIATVISVLMVGYIVVSSLTPRYTASALVEINARQSQVVDYQAVLSGLSGDVASIETEMKIIQSRKIARRSVSKLDLVWDPEFNAELRPISLIATWRRDAADWFREWANEYRMADAESEGKAEPQLGVNSIASSVLMGLSRFLHVPPEQADSAEATIDRRNENLIDTFLSNVSVAPEGRSRVIRISFESESPKTAAAAVNTIADFYIVAQLEAKFEATKRATTWLSERVEQLRAEVQIKEQQIEAYRAEFGLLKGEENVTLTNEKVSELNAQYVQELANLAEANARLQQINKLLNSPKGVESATEVLASPLIRDLRAEETRIERSIAELSEEYGERHPNLINARAQLRDVRAKIQVEVDRIVQGLRNEVAVARARSSSLAQSLEAVKGEVADLNQREVQLRAFERDANASRALLENLMERTKQTASQESFQQADASILSYASEPEIPSFPRKKLFYPAILATALLLSLMLAFLVEKLDLGFRSAEQITHVLGVRSLGLVPVISKISTMGRPPQDYILENPQSAFGEAIRGLYTNVLLSDVRKRPKVLLITSSLPGEGKSTVTVSLGRMLASLGQKVLIVDCDLRRPTTHKAFKMEPGPGLSDCLRGVVSPQEVICVDEVSGAHVLQAGTLQNHSPDQLDSNEMQTLLRSLGRQYEVIILDSAPVLAIADTLFVARLADKTIFLVRWARTRRESVGLALKQLRAVGADLSGVLVTMVNVKTHAQYGYADSGVYQGDLKKYYL